MIAEPSAPPLSLLSVVIPARDEEDCIASTVEHLHVELSLRGVPHEIVVVVTANLPGEYWDFWDHYLPLTEKSLRRHLIRDVSFKKRSKAF